MLRPITRIRSARIGGKESRSHVVIVLKCGHITLRIRPRGMAVRIHCPMCSFLEKERAEKDKKRAAKKERRRVRKLRQQMKVEKLLMAKKKMAPKKVAKKKDLKKKSKEKKIKAGRKLVLVARHLYAPKGSLLSKVVKAMQSAEDYTMGENELVVAMEKSGVKDEGKKTVKKLVKGALRNMLRAGVVVKHRDLKHDDALQAFIEGKTEDKKKKDNDEDDKDEDESEDESDDEDEEETQDDSEDEDDESDESEDEDADEDEEEKPKAKKKTAASKKKTVKKKAGTKKKSKK
jgi:hypothetical protein